MNRFILRSLSWLRLARRLPHLRHLIRLLWRLARDPRVPIALKGMLGAAILYGLSPVDVIPESVALVFGLVDDLAIIIAAVNWFLRLAPRHVVDEHLQALPPTFQQAFQAWRDDPPPSDRTTGAG